MVEELFEVDNQMGEQNEACEGTMLKELLLGERNHQRRLSVQKGTSKDPSRRDHC